MSMKKNSEVSQPPVPAMMDSPVPPKNLWSPLTISLTVLVVAMVLSIVFFDTIVNQPMIKSFLTGGQYQSNKFSDSAILPAPSPIIPTPIILKPDEGTKGNYTVSQSAKDTGPTFSTVTFDPLDVQQGQNLTITVTLSSQSPVSQVTGTLTGDTTSIPIALQKSSQTATTTVWSATFSITDTLLYKYILKLEAVNGTGTSSVTVAPRS